MLFFPITCAPPHDSVQNYAKLATWLCDCRPCLLRYRRYLRYELVCVLVYVWMGFASL